MEQTLNQSEAFFLKYKKAIITVVVAIIVIIVGAVLYKTYIPPSPRGRLISHRGSSSRHWRATALVSRALPSSPTSTAQQLQVTWQTSTQVSAMPSWVSGTLP